MERPNIIQCCVNQNRLAMFLSSYSKMLKMWNDQMFISQENSDYFNLVFPTYNSKHLQ